MTKKNAIVYTRSHCLCCWSCAFDLENTTGMDVRCVCGVITRKYNFWHHDLCICDSKTLGNNDSRQQANHATFAHSAMPLNQPESLRPSYSRKTLTFSLCSNVDRGVVNEERLVHCILGANLSISLKEPSRELDLCERTYPEKLLALLLLVSVGVVETIATSSECKLAFFGTYLTVALKTHNWMGICLYSFSSYSIRFLWWSVLCGWDIATGLTSGKEPSPILWIKWVVLSRNSTWGWQCKNLWKSQDLFVILSTLYVEKGKTGKL